MPIQEKVSNNQKNCRPNASPHGSSTYVHHDQRERDHIDNTHHVNARRFGSHTKPCRVAKEGNEAHDTRKDRKAQVKRENAATAQANRTLEKAEVQEIERRSMKCSSTAANQRVFKL